MKDKGKKKIAVISMARNDDFFIPKWLDHYSKEFGVENLFLVLDGLDQSLPLVDSFVNIIKVPHLQLGRAAGDKNRANMVSTLAKTLFHRYDKVIACDIDEFLVIDPKTGVKLLDYLQHTFSSSSLSALGLDVGQHLEEEKVIDIDKPFLEQRNYAHVSARYTKPVVANRPLRWGSGFHRVKGKNFTIDPNLYLFHFGMVDFARSTSKTEDASRIAQGWQAHLERRNELFDLISKCTAIHGDKFFDVARKRQSLYRPIFAWNKPGTLREKPIIVVPERFKQIV